MDGKKNPLVGLSEMWHIHKEKTDMWKIVYGID